MKRFFGSDRVEEESNLKVIVLLMRVRGKSPMKKLTPKEALKFMIKNDFCNPHQLVRNRKKLTMRIDFFKELFNRVPVYLLNTIETPQQSLERLKGTLE